MKLLSYTHFLQIKMFRKYDKNYKTLSRDNLLLNLVHNFDLAHDYIINNLNEITKYTSFDQTVGKSS